MSGNGNGHRFVLVEERGYVEDELLEAENLEEMAELVSEKAGLPGVNDGRS